MLKHVNFSVSFYKLEIKSQEELDKFEADILEACKKVSPSGNIEGAVYVDVHNYDGEFEV